MYIWYFSFKFAMSSIIGCIGIFSMTKGEIRQKIDFFSIDNYVIWFNTDVDLCKLVKGEKEHKKILICANK